MATEQTKKTTVAEPAKTDAKATTRTAEKRADKTLNVEAAPLATDALTLVEDARKAVKKLREKSTNLREVAPAEGDFVSAGLVHNVTAALDGVDAAMAVLQAQAAKLAAADVARPTE